MSYRNSVSVCSQLMLFFIYSSCISAAESIASIEYINRKLLNESGKYEIEIHSITTLSNVTINGYKVAELSGLAWDDDENILYALSDNGYLLYLQLLSKNSQLTDILFLKGQALLDNKNRPLKFKESDSEGLALINSRNKIKGDTELLICFERISRLIKYTPDGVPIARVKLPEPLSDIRNFRRENNSLEAVTYHDELGVLVGPEKSLKDQDEANISVYSIDGKTWNFPLHNEYYGALVDMTTMPDGNILLMERSYGGLFPSLEITLHRFSPAEKSGKIETIYTFTNDEIINENFEGITHFKDNQYLMVSDDNNHPLHRTLIVHLSITRLK